MGPEDRRLPCPDPPLADGVVALRPWEHRDVRCVRLASTDRHITEHTSVPTVVTVDAGVAFVERQRSRQTDGDGVSLAIEDAASGEAVGLVIAQLRPQRSVVGLGYWVVPPARGRGLAGRAIALLATWLLDETTTTRVEALVVPGNDPSRRTLERLGFQEEGRLRSYLDGRQDVVMCSLLAGDLASTRDGGVGSGRPHDPRSAPERRDRGTGRPSASGSERDS